MNLSLRSFATSVVRHGDGATNGVAHSGAP